MTYVCAFGEHDETDSISGAETNTADDVTNELEHRQVIALLDTCRPVDREDHVKLLKAFYKH